MEPCCYHCYYCPEELWAEIFQLNGQWLHIQSRIASFPVPRPAFRCLQYGKAGRAWYIFSREHDVIEKWQNFQNEDATFRVLFNHLHVQRSVSMTVAPR